MEVASPHLLQGFVPSFRLRVRIRLYSLMSFPLGEGGGTDRSKFRITNLLICLVSSSIGVNVLSTALW